MSAEVQAIEKVPERDAEIVSRPSVEVAEKDFEGYAGVATVALSDSQAKDLAELLPDDAHDILPTGEVYVSQVHYRRLLIKVFGPGGWALVPRGPYSTQKGAKTETITREYALVGQGGRFISEAIGEAEYQPTNDRMSYASACEAVKSNALTRCCKDLGIASECWDRRWCEKWIAKHAIKVWRKGTPKPQWRRKDATPWYDESGPSEPRQERREEAAEPRPSQSRPPSETPSCAHCGSINVQRDPKAPGWLVCADCKKGTQVS
jgi:ribonuclease HI